MLVQRFSTFLALLIVRRPQWIVAATIGVVLLCFWILRRSQTFDSEVLNLLPQQAEAIQALKTINSDFAQGREITFAIRGEPEAVANFTDYFVEKLRSEPWVVRVLSGSPMEDPEGIEQLTTLVPSLLLNLEPEEFQKAVHLLAPSAIEQRLQRSRAEMEAGSLNAEFKADADPLGLLTAALKPFASVLGKEKGYSLTSEDGTLHVVPVVTNQPSLSQPDCQAMMQKIRQFMVDVRHSWKEPAPEILVTGRTAYVAEISASMERDITITSMVSILTVAGLFYLGFRRFLPLLGIVVTLSLSCFISFALGCLVFQSVNMIAVAFCSILVGLGDDFSLLLYNRYLRARDSSLGHEEAVATSIRDVGPGIFYVSLTTATGFLVLWFSGSSGFAQLGTLIAIGIVLCGLSMVTLLFLFIRPKQPKLQRDPFLAMVGRYVESVLHKPRLVAIPSIILSILALAAAATPWFPLEFDTNPRSLEPKDSAAAMALKAITNGLTIAAEPVILLVDAPDAQTAHDQWTRLSAHLEKLQSAGVLQSYSTPAAMMISPALVSRNIKSLRTVDLAASKTAFAQALDREGFNPSTFEGTVALLNRLDALQTSESPDQFDLRKSLAPSSAWWFLIERYFSARAYAAAAYVKPAKALSTEQEQESFEKAIKDSGVPLKVTGWNYAMISLVPWARHELVVFSACVGTLILAFLGVAYRAWQPWVIHTASMVFAIAATITTLKLAGIHINMLNALAFPLLLGVGVDYGMHVLFALREHGDRRTNLVTVLKPLLICGLTTIAGFGSLILARNPALSGLGLVCSLGVFWCLASALLFTLPVARMCEQGSR